MKSWTELAQYRPEKVESELRKIRLSFPSLDGGEETHLSRELDSLRERLAGIDEKALERAAYSFTQGDLRRMLLFLCLPDEDAFIRRKVERILSLRVSTGLLLEGITKLLVHYPARDLERLLAHLLTKRPELASGSLRSYEQVIAWLRTGSLCEGIMETVLQVNPISLTRWFENQGMGEYLGVQEEVWKGLLRTGSREFYARRNPDELLLYLRSAPRDLQMTFGQRYLALLEDRQNWHESVLSWVLDRFGLPETPEAAPGFWNLIPEEVRQEFRLWAVGRRLEEFFQKEVHDPNGRFAFWSSFLEHIRDARASEDGSVGLIDFGIFFVIEFADVGNAAYIYPRSQLERMRKALRDPGITQGWYRNLVLKDQAAAWDRIIHRSGWQWKYRPLIKNRLRRSW